MAFVCTISNQKLKVTKSKNVASHILPHLAVHVLSYLHSIRARFWLISRPRSLLEASFHSGLESTHIPLNHLRWAAPTLGVPFGCFALGTKPSFIFCVCDSPDLSVTMFPLHARDLHQLLLTVRKTEENMVIFITFLDILRCVITPGHPTLCNYP